MKEIQDIIVGLGEILDSLKSIYRKLTIMLEKSYEVAAKQSKKEKELMDLQSELKIKAQDLSQREAAVKGVEDTIALINKAREEKAEAERTKREADKLKGDVLAKMKELEEKEKKLDEEWEKKLALYKKQVEAVKQAKEDFEKEKKAYWAATTAKAAAEAVK